MNQQLNTTNASALQATQLDYFLIDGSGSMVGKWQDNMRGIDAFVKTLAAENIHSHGIVQVFDDRNLDWIQRDGSIADWPRFHEAPLQSNFGTTPLYDAINLMARRLAELDPARASIVIVTDGNENKSRHTTIEQAKALLDWMRAQGWQVTFLGANFDNSRQAALLGAESKTSIGVRSQKLLETYTALGKKRAAYGRTGDDIGFSDDEKLKFGGFLGGPSK